MAVLKTHQSLLTACTHNHPHHLSQPSHHSVPDCPDAAHAVHPAWGWPTPAAGRPRTHRPYQLPQGSASTDTAQAQGHPAGVSTLGGALAADWLPLSTVDTTCCPGCGWVTERWSVCTAGSAGAGHGSAALQAHLAALHMCACLPDERFLPTHLGTCCTALHPAPLPPGVRAPADICPTAQPAV